ncbi:hypothetical protein XH99_02655 [Bradyrhizobium nanningense]|uniref:Uncharacterized protein n=1 Tax=Bradyrhizobium nanningense TaxID=1325118 RepID=A0A4Q0SD83_9BRAD|nr:hypothetical protein XH84_15345 [Bradyrhizobium nanningense]RXH37081.1 hypothetical protein XH99_02655 [Bradyrhizobium nanningense]
MLLLLSRQGAWPKKRPRPMPAGPGGRDVVVEFLAHDSFHGPAEAGHVVEVDFTRAFDHEEADSTAIAQNQGMYARLLHPGGEPLALAPSPLEARVAAYQRDQSGTVRSEKARPTAKNSTSGRLAQLPRSTEALL